MDRRRTQYDARGFIVVSEALSGYLDRMRDEHHTVPGETRVYQLSSLNAVPHRALVGSARQRVCRVVDANELRVACDAAYDGMRVCVVNEGSAQHAGGNLYVPVGTGEMGLFFNTDLSRTLTDTSAQYPLDKEDVVFSSNVRVYRSSSGDWIGVAHAPVIDVITCAPLHKPMVQNFAYVLPYQSALTQEKIDGIFRVGALHRVDVLVMGLFGCGYWAHPTREVAIMLHRAVNMYGGYFKHILLAGRTRVAVDALSREFGTVAQTDVGGDDGALPVVAARVHVRVAGSDPPPPPLLAVCSPSTNTSIDDDGRRLKRNRADPDSAV